MPVLRHVRVTMLEAENKMSPSALGIVFGPTVLRCSGELPVQESMKHIVNQSRCVQAIIEGQLRKVKRNLKDINSLDQDTISAEQRLSVHRVSFSGKVSCEIIRTRLQLRAIVIRHNVLMRFRSRSGRCRRVTRRRCTKMRMRSFASTLNACSRTSTTHLVFAQQPHHPHHC